MPVTSDALALLPVPTPGAQRSQRPPQNMALRARPIGTSARVSARFFRLAARVAIVLHRNQGGIHAPRDAMGTVFSLSVLQQRLTAKKATA